MPMPKGSKHTEETKQRISDTLIGNKRALGHRHTEETKQYLSDVNTGENNNQWKGGKGSMKGYCRIWIGNKKRTLEQRVIWENYHNMKLPDGFIIHHIDENKLNNSPENLAAMRKGDHLNLHIALKRGRSRNGADR